MGENVILKTDDKSLALSILDRYLESPDTHNAQIQKLDGLYTVEVSRPVDEAGPDHPACVASKS